MDGMGRSGRQRFRMQTGIGENSESLRKLPNRQSSKFVGVRHRAGSFIRIL
jgi:hypothetical protein